MVLAANILPSVPFLPQECASPPAWSVKAVRFAPVNANYAALTARAAKRRGPPRRAFASFFKRKSRLNKGRKKEQCQKDNTPLGENYCARRSKSRGECSKLTPPFTITASYVREHIVQSIFSLTARRHEL